MTGFNMYEIERIWIKRIYSVIVLLLLSAGIFSQATRLTRSTPEAEGVSSEAIIKFLDAVAESKHELHSFMVLRHGKVVSEGWWKPYAPDLKHTMYSVSKSFTATAIGFAVAEKKISVEDKVTSFFPQDLPAEISPNLEELRVKHLLSMTVGQKPDPSGPVGMSENWVRTFLNTPIVNKPGSEFLYNSAGTYMLSAIVQKVTGQKVIDYLQPRLFGPLGIQGIDWETDPRGINVGGWGLRLKTEDMAKFGQLFLQKGNWNGKQIIPTSWIEEATSAKILQDPKASQGRKDSSDWLQGYCYQMWRSRNNSYRGDGAYGQFILVLPEKDAVVIITSESTNLQSELNLVWQYLLPGFHDGKLSGDSKSLEALKQKIASLSLPLGEKTNSKLESQIAGKSYEIASATSAIRIARVNFKNGICQLTLNTDSINYDLQFGSGKWVAGQTTRFGPYLAGRARGNRIGLPPFKVEGNYQWKDEKTLELVLRYIESPHKETFTFIFDGDDVSIEIRDVMNRTNLKGSVIKS